MRAGRVALAILIAALILRLVLVFHSTWYPVSDTRDYHDFAYSLLHYSRYQQQYQGRSVEYLGLTFYAYRMPGYPLFLAMIYGVFGWDPLHAQLGNVALELATAWFLYLIGRRTLGNSTALMSLGLFALHVLWTPSLMTESLFTALFAGITLLLVYEVPRRSLVHALGVGVVLALATFVRPIAVSFIPFMLYEIWRGKYAYRHGAALLLPLLLAIGGWSYRNYRIFDQVVLLSTNFGPHNAESFGLDKENIVLRLREQGSNMAQINNTLIYQIVQHVRASPISAVRLYLGRIAGLFSLDNPPAVVRALLWEHTFIGPSGTPFINSLFRILYGQYYLTYPMGILGGIWASLRRRIPRILWAVPVTYILLHAFVSEGHIRFAAPLYPFICLFGAYGMNRLLKWVTNRDLNSMGEEDA